MKCQNCGKDFEPIAGQDKCPYCGATVPLRREPIRDEASLTSADSEGLRPPELSSQPIDGTWDGEGPFFSRLWKTWTKVMFHPGQFFKSMPVTGGLGRPLFYAIMLGTIGIVGLIGWQFIISLIQLPLLSAFSSGFKGGAVLPVAFSGVIWIVFILAAPLFILVGIFIWTGILHLCLMIMGGNKKGFKATFRVVAYGYSPSIFMIIPLCGGYIGGIWAIVLVIIGLKEAHQTTWSRVILAYFLPLVFCCIFTCIIAIAAGVAIPAALSSAGSGSAAGG